MSLRWRIALILAAVAFGVGAFAAIASHVGTASQLRSGIDDTLRSRATAVNTIGDDDGGGRGGRGGDDGDRGVGAGDGGCAAAGSYQPASAAQLVSPSGVVTACIEGGTTLPTTRHERSLRPGQVELRTVAIAGERYRLLSTPWHDGGTLQIARSLQESDALLRRMELELGGIVALATAVAAGLGWIVATRIARPITRLRDATHHIAATLDLSAPIDIGGTGEVGSLAASFSTMVAAVARSREQQRRLVSDASHEMRTPLTSLRSNIELIGQIDRLPADERREVVADVLLDIDELSSLLGELVDLASDTADAEPNEPVNLASLARDVGGRTHRRTERVITIEETAPTDVEGRPRQLERAISNLVDNAVKYSDSAAPIEISVHDGTLIVRDRGRGIAEQDRQRIFDRFYRAVDVRTAPGSGLGLAIVAEIVRNHGGTVFADNRDGGGAEVGFTLPHPATDGPGTLPPST